jgi:hypothetical protein
MNDYEFVPRPSRILATLFSWSFGSMYRVLYSTTLREFTELEAFVCGHTWLLADQRDEEG